MGKYSLPNCQPVDLLLHHAPIDMCALNRNAMERVHVSFVLGSEGNVAHFSGLCEDIRCMLRSLATWYVYAFKIKMNVCVSVD